ncbi:MAG: hypothetical protein HYV26_05245, partial [Candidatus Hydrogenedentes bacterium]|nr:hypothetical protein [Candidatus Hydrogenedentota bacterium]
MEVFPAVDPIPLPAPVWLFMALHTLTLILHFIALHFLIGGLLLAPAWGLAGRWSKDTSLRQVSQLIARRLPVVMTYVINLGVPPLLFTQVLYGRALYTSSILIGAWWISVIGLLLFGYSMLYVMVQRGETGRTFVLAGGAALLSVLMIAMIYSTNMTLMLRPERWPGIYRANPFGATFHTGDPTMFPRWLFMMLGSAGIGGVGLLLLSLKQDLTHDVQRFLRQWGGRLTVIFIALQVAAAVWVVQVQTAPVMDALAGVLFYRFCEGGWLVSAALLIILG